ncbi:hypothetical protein ACSLNR_29320, partial [Escherichia coli]|uniref:hypothetical protein n=1 Tax=Escherichia coli TaxID=562 RepID=UPI003EE2D541
YVIAEKIKPDTNRPKKQTFNKKHFEQYHKTVTTIIRLLKKTGGETCHGEEPEKLTRFACPTPHDPRKDFANRSPFFSI